MDVHSGIQRFASIGFAAAALAKGAGGTLERVAEENGRVVFYVGNLPPDFVDRVERHEVLVEAGSVADWVEQLAALVRTARDRRTYGGRR